MLSSKESAFTPIQRPFAYIHSGSAGRSLDELYRLIHADPVVRDWSRTTLPEYLSVKTDIKIRVTTKGRIRIRRFYWSLQRRTATANSDSFCARTLIMEPEGAPIWLDFPEDPQLPFASALLDSDGDCQVLHYVPLRRLSVIKRGEDKPPTVYKLKRKGRAQEAASRLKCINEAHAGAFTRYSLPTDLGCCSQSGALRQTFCPGISLAQRLYASDAQLMIEQLGRVLASFHDMPVDTLPTEESDDISDLSDMCRQLAAFWPAAADRINRCHDWLMRNKRPAHDLTLCHGDLSPDNLLVEDDRWSLIDLDLAHLGDSIRDVAQLLVHLDVAVSESRSRSFVPRTAFLAGYLTDCPRPVSSRLLRWHCCRAELEYLQVALRKDNGNARSRVESLLRAESHCLGSYR